MSAPHATAELIAKDLVSWAGEDLALRRHLIETGALFAGYDPQMKALHDINTDRLSDVIDRIGWPSAALVGERGAAAAWLIAQHAIGRPDFFRRCAALVGEAAERSEAPAWQFAMMTDRIRVYEGRPQVYGCQFDWDAEGQLSPLPIEDPEHVDERRRAVGLKPLAEKQAELRAQAEAEGDRPPTDYEARRLEGERWAKETGWRS